MSQQPCRISKSQRRDIVARYCDGETGVSIAKSQNLSSWSVYKVLRDANVPRRRPGNTGPRKGRLNADTLQSIRDQFLDGLCLEEIAENHGVSRMTVYLKLKAMGMPTGSATKHVSREKQMIELRKRKEEEET